MSLRGTGTSHIMGNQILQYHLRYSRHLMAAEDLTKLLPSLKRYTVSARLSHSFNSEISSWPSSEEISLYAISASSFSLGSMKSASLWQSPQSPSRRRTSRPSAICKIRPPRLTKCVPTPLPRYVRYQASIDPQFQNHKFLSASYIPS